jgi:oligoendopeptidase F
MTELSKENKDANAAQKLPKHGELPVEKTWDLGLLYATEERWEQDYARIESTISTLAEYQGKLAQSEENILATLRARDEIMLVVLNLYLYASMNLDVDNTVTKYQEMRERATALWGKANSSTAFISPELAAIPEDVAANLFAETSALQKDYGFEIADVLRQSDHMLPAEQEALLLRAAAALAQTGHNVFQKWAFADHGVLGTIPDVNGGTIEVTHGNFSQLAMSQDRNVRESAFKIMFGAFASGNHTLAEAYNGQVKSNVFYAHEHKYNTVFEQYMHQVNIPAGLPNGLVKTAEKNIDTLHRLLLVRKKELQVSDLHWYDLSVPLRNVDFSPSYAESEVTIRKAQAILGNGYLLDVDKAFTSRWIDGLPCQNKRSGGYTSGSYSSPPFMLMNYLPNVEGIYTKAHELGHMVNAMRSRAKQPYHYSGNPINVAEVASTLNEHILSEYLLANTDDPNMRFFILYRQAEGFKNTFFTQLMFHEFELQAHALVESGQAITAFALNGIYLGLLKKYFGAVVTIDDTLKVGWSRIPHFYNAFYVWNYASSWAVSTVLATMLKTEGQAAVDRILAMLEVGSSKYPMDILRDAGVNLSTTKPLQIALDRFAAIVSELERLQATK